MKNSQSVVGYLPNERPSIGKLLFFAFQQMLVMFPATVLVALLTGFHLSTTIFASGVATIGFLLITRGKLPLYYGSSFSYIPAIVAVTGVQMGQIASDDLIGQAQFGIICSGLVSILAGLIVIKFGMRVIEKVLPATVTGTIAMTIGLSLTSTALSNAAAYDPVTGTASNAAWIVAIITLLATVLFSVYLKGVLGQLSILLGIATGYVAAIVLELAFGLEFTMFDAEMKSILTRITEVFNSNVVALPHFTAPRVNWSVALAIMPIALATIPESTAHLVQLDLYVNDLARKKGKEENPIKNKLGLNLIGDGAADIISSIFGGPAGTNYGENLSTMSITRNFSTAVLYVAAGMAVVVSLFTPLTRLIQTVPSPVINGACIYLFGAIAAQGAAIMVEKKVNLFNARNLAVVATMFVIGVGGTFAFPNGMIPFFTVGDFVMELPAIATASVVGILLNLLLSIGNKEAEQA